MHSHYTCWLWLVALGALGCSGCGLVPTSQLTAAQSQNRMLAEQSKSQLAEIENLKAHTRKVEDQLIKSEEELANVDRKSATDQKQLANFQRERDNLQKHFASYTRGSAGLPAGVSSRLADLAKRYPTLQYDPSTGISKFETDVLFDSGEAKLRPDTEKVLAEFARIFQEPDARDLKIMVVGHTDNLKIAKKDIRDHYPDNWHLSTARALSVADQLRKAGLHEDHMGVAGFGGHQPIAPNTTAEDRRKNRRVEIFVVGPDVPIVGWTESMTSVY